MSKIVKTRNFSATQTLQYFNSSQNLKTFDSDKLKLEDIKHIYNFLYEDNFSNILIQSKEFFLNNIDFNIKEIIIYHFDNIYINTSFFQQTINKYKKEIEEKYLNDYSILFEQFQINKNNFKEEDRKYLNHFLKHCVNTCQYAYHRCPNNKKGKFIMVGEKNNTIKSKNQQIHYVICIDCKKCYPSSCINMICTPCNIDYLSFMLKENEDSNIALATWEKYHCGGLLQDEVMKCIKCKKQLYLNLLANKLICQNKNCNFESKPSSILWKCSFCSKDFRSKAKVYNPLEFKNMKKAINNALIMRIKSNPKVLPCCKKDTKELTFFHKEECKGILYKGFLSGKEIIVCRKCHAMNFIDKFNWICPICGKKFHLHHSSSVTPFKIKKCIINKENIDNNSGKKPNRIFFVRKDSSSSINNDLDINKNHCLFRNKKMSFLNITKDDNISYNSNNQNINRNIENNNQIINKYKNIQSKEKEKNGIIKMIKLPQKEREKNNSDLRYGSKSKDIYIEIDNDEIKIKNKKKKRKTLYEVLEDKKKQSLGSIKNNISLKNTTESIIVEKNFNKIKNSDDGKQNVGNKDKEIYQLSKTSLFSNKENKNNNINNQNETNNEGKITELINDVNQNNKEKEQKLNIIFTNQNSGINNSNRNKNNLNFMKSSDDLLRQKKMLKCKSYNLFKDGKENDEINNSNNNMNHQTNYLYTTNSNYNIKVSLNINHNICPFPKKEENDYKNLKLENENNYKKIYNNSGINKIKEIYLQEILKNTGVNLGKDILNNNDNINILNNNINLENKKIFKNNNHNNKRKFLGNISPRINSTNEYNLVNSSKYEKSKNLRNQKSKEFYYKTTYNVFTNSFLNSTKGKDSKKLDFNFNSENSKKNEPKKLLFNGQFNFINRNNSTYSNIIKVDNKNVKRYNLNYINLKNNEKNNNEYNSKNLKNIKEYTKEDEETCDNKTKVTNLNDIENTETLINTSNNNKTIKDKFKYDLMKNVIVSPEIISQLSKDSIIPIFNDKDFRYIRPIGEGAYGLIYLVENIHNRKQYALKKILCKDLYEIMKHKNQLELIYSMNHKNIMEIYNLQYKHLDNTTYAIYILMERAQNDWSIDIRKRIINKKPYKEEEIINILKQVISALAYLQRKNIAHRDIKPQNILLFQGNIFKVADLGEARNVNNANNKQMTLRGSELYMSPSLYERHKFNRKGAFHNAFKSDVFSLGFSTLYAMQLNLKIIENIRELNNMKIIINSIYKDMGKKVYSDKLMKIIFKMIEIDENKRYDFIELEKELKNNF